MRLALSQASLPLVLAGLLACADPPGGGALQAAAPQPGEMPGRIQVLVDAQPLEGDRRAAFLEHGGSARIADAVLAELAESESPRLEPPYTIDVTVTHFRLRSTQSAFWWGSMAGADMLDVSVSILRDGAVERKYETDTSTIMGGLIRPASIDRFDRMVDSIAERIVEGLNRDESN